MSQQAHKAWESVDSEPIPYPATNPFQGWTFHKEYYVPDNDAPMGGATTGPDKTVPKEFGMPKVGKVEPEKDAYVDSPSSVAGVVQTHDRDSVQPGPEPEGRYAPEAKRKADK